VLTDTRGALYAIMQVSSNRYLDAHEIESLDFRVVTRPRQDNDTQLWRILRDRDRAAIRQVSSGRALQPYLTEDMDFLLGVSVSWFYKTRNCQPTQTEKRRALVDAAVAKEFRAARGLHGSPRLFPDLIRRDFTACRMNQKWVGDITEIPTAAGKLYQATVIDLYSRRLLGAATSRTDRANERWT
jgi:hypothetical protein